MLSEDFIDEPDEPEPFEREVLLFSHVSGGPDTCIGFCCARPTVPPRAPLRTVPKSHRSSGSAPAGLLSDQ